MFSRSTVCAHSLRILACALPLVPGGCHKADQSRSALPSAGRETWPTISGADSGLDTTKLDAFALDIGGHGVIIRHDAIAYRWGTPEKPLDIASASKAVYSFLVLKAVEEGRIPSLDQPVVQWMPELAKLNPALGYKDARITWRNLINQSSCYGVTEAPGTAFDYNDFQTGLLWTLIFEKLHGTKGEAAIRVLESSLFDPVGVENKPKFRPMGSNTMLLRLIISPLDFARFGLVFLHDGKWKDSQILSADHVRLVRTSPLPPTLPRTKGDDAEMLPAAPSYGGGKNQEDHLGCYSYMWWLNKRGPSGTLLFPSAPEDAFAAIGYGGERVLMVVPSLDMVISWNTKHDSDRPMLSIGRMEMDAALKILFSAVK